MAYGVWVLWKYGICMGVGGPNFNGKMKADFAANAQMEGWEPLGGHCVIETPDVGDIGIHRHSYISKGEGWVCRPVSSPLTD